MNLASVPGIHPMTNKLISMTKQQILPSIKLNLNNLQSLIIEICLFGNSIWLIPVLAD